MLRSSITRRITQRDLAARACNIDDPTANYIASPICRQRLLPEELGKSVLATQKDSTNVDTYCEVESLSRGFVDTDTTGLEASRSTSRAMSVLLTMLCSCQGLPFTASFSDE